MRARGSPAGNVKVDRCVTDLALFVGLSYPTVDSIQICIANANFIEASLQALPVPRIPPQPASVAAEHFIHSVTKQIATIFGWYDRFVRRNHFPIHVCKLWHQCRSLKYNLPEGEILGENRAR